jgi:hypothetical protein
MYGVIAASGPRAKTRSVLAKSWVAGKLRNDPGYRMFILRRNISQDHPGFRAGADRV